MKPWAVLTSSLVGVLLCLPAWGGGGRGGRETKSIRNETGSRGPPHPDVDPPDEEPDTTYRFVGLRIRYIVIPQFYMSLFGSGGTTVGVPAVGPEFAIRKNGFEYVLSAMYASYAMDATPFKAKSDGNDAWELVDSNIKALYLMSDFLWSTAISPRYAIVYGGGFGLAAVFGDLHRVQ